MNFSINFAIVKQSYAFFRECSGKSAVYIGRTGIVLFRKEVYYQYVITESKDVSTCAEYRKKQIVGIIRMIDITDKNHKPNMTELTEYIGNPIFGELCDAMDSRYKALVSVEYSGDSVLPGWNVRFRKGGKTLLRLYPKKGYFTVLTVVGSKEKDRVEEALPQMSDAIRGIYEGTAEGMGQRWMLIDLCEADVLYENVLRIADFRRKAE